jgi:N-acyl-D-amino-acid deacylase
MIELSLGSGLKHFHFSHLKTAGVENFGKLDKVFELFDEAQSRGLVITCDRYPYVESMTQLSVALPGAWKNLDDTALKKKLESTEEKLALIAELRTAKSDGYWQRCRIVNTPHPRFSSYRGRGIIEIPGDVAENVVEMLAFDPVNCQAAFSVMSAENMKNIIAQPFCVAGSDGNALPGDGRFGKTHPRSFGAVARFLRLTLDMGLPIEECISKVSGKTAAIFGLEERGIIAPGKQGDLVLFDPDSVDSKADFLAPETPAEGIVFVIKNGEIIYS